MPHLLINKDLTQLAMEGIRKVDDRYRHSLARARWTGRTKWEIDKREHFCASEELGYTGKWSLHDLTGSFVFSNCCSPEWRGRLAGLPQQSVGVSHKDLLH